MWNPINSVKTLYSNYQTRRLLNYVMAALQNGCELVNTTKIETYQTRRYEYREVMIDHLNYQLQDTDGNFLAYVPGYVVNMLPEDQYRKVTDSCDLGTFYRVEVVLSDWDNLTTTEIYSVFNRFEIASSIVRATLVKQYPNVLAQYADHYMPTLAYDKDCKPSKKQAKEAFGNAVLRQAKIERKRNELLN